MGMPRQRTAQGEEATDTKLKPRQMGMPGHYNVAKGRPATETKMTQAKHRPKKEDTKQEERNERAQSMVVGATPCK